MRSVVDSYVGEIWHYLIFWKTCACICVCVRVWLYVCVHMLYVDHVCVGAPEDQSRALEPWRWNSCESYVWVLRTAFRSSTREAGALNCWKISPATHSRLYMLRADSSHWEAFRRYMSPQRNLFTDLKKVFTLKILTNWAVSEMFCILTDVLTHHFEEKIILKK